MSVEVVILGILAVVALLSAYQSYMANKTATEAKVSAVAAQKSLGDAATFAAKTKEIIEDTHKIVNSQRTEMVELIKTQSELIESLHTEIKALKS